MDDSEEAHQNFLEYQFSRLNAAFSAFLQDPNQDEHSGWWHRNFQVEMVCSLKAFQMILKANLMQIGITSQIGSVRLLGLSCHIPYFVKQLSAWIDIDRPPTGLQIDTLENSGFTPPASSEYPHRIVSQYRQNWWAVPGGKDALVLMSWKSEVQQAFAEFRDQVRLQEANVRCASNTFLDFIGAGPHTAAF